MSGIEAHTASRQRANAGHNIGRTEMHLFKAAARTFEVHGQAGEESINFGKRVDQGLEPNRVTVCYFESDRDKLCLVAAHALTHTFGLYNRIRAVVSRA